MNNDKKPPARPTVAHKIEETQNNYYVQALMSESDDAEQGGLNINASGRNNSSYTNSSKNKKASDQVFDILMQNDLALQLAASNERLANLEEKYGEDFDLNILAEFANDEDYKRIASIQDINARRDAVAGFVKEGVENGTIDPDKLQTIDPDGWSKERTENMDIRKNYEHQYELKQDLEIDSPSASVNLSAPAPSF